jgi:hypothetical protein
MALHDRYVQQVWKCLLSQHRCPVKTHELGLTPPGLVRRTPTRTLHRTDIPYDEPQSTSWFTAKYTALIQGCSRGAPAMRALRALAHDDADVMPVRSGTAAAGTTSRRAYIHKEALSALKLCKKHYQNISRLLELIAKKLTSRPINHLCSHADRTAQPRPVCTHARTLQSKPASTRSKPHPSHPSLQVSAMRAV